MNQALGRVVRHQDDYGILVLADSRYDQGYYNDSLSKWVRDSLLNNKQSFSYANFIGELSTFQKRFFAGPVIELGSDDDNY